MNQVRCLSRIWGDLKLEVLELMMLNLSFNGGIGIPESPFCGGRPFGHPFLHKVVPFSFILFQLERRCRTVKSISRIYYLKVGTLAQ